MPLALFGITNEGLSLFVNLLLLFLVVVWIALIAWTFLDARRRIRDPVLVACATGASLFPYVGTVVYAILRPPEFIEDAHERELEIRAAELRLRQLEEQSCPSCGYPIERTYLRCPSCRTRVKDPCEACEKPIDPRWTVCPYCETPQRRAASRARRAPEEPRRGRSEPREAPEAAPKRTARAKRAAAQEGRRKPAQKDESGQARATTSRQAAAGSRQADTKPRKASAARPPAAPPSSARESPGEERPRPAPAS
jgi:Double zinc ribbon